MSDRSTSVKVMVPLVCSLPASPPLPTVPPSSLIDASLRRGRDHRRVFGAVHRDDDVLAGGAAIAVVGLHRIGQRHDVVLAQEVEVLSAML